ncbi:MAG: hypothetical protein OCD02_22420 [Spirochaetaceae bacterium]
MRYVFLTIILLLSTAVFSEDPRLFQFISDKEDESFISIEAGNHVGLSLHLNNMSFNVGYSYLIQSGFYISTDIFLYHKELTENINLKIGLGGGIIFNPSLDNFESDAYLRVPIKFQYKDLFCLASPIIGTSMFEYDISWIFGGFVGIGYQLETKQKKTIKDSNTETEENKDVEANPEVINKNEQPKK